MTPRPAPLRLLVSLLALLCIAAGATIHTPSAGAASPRAGDRDGDRLPDRWERRHRLSVRERSATQDADRDRLDNLLEFRLRTHPRRRDTDRDGFSDAVEVRAGTSPRSRRSKPRPRPAVSPPRPVARPIATATARPAARPVAARPARPAAPTAPAAPAAPPAPVPVLLHPTASDTDGDGLPDDAEARHGGDPRRADTDGDTIRDGDEVLAGEPVAVPTTAERVLWAAPGGAAGAAGTEAAPLTFAAALQAADGGELVLVLGGEHAPASDLQRRAEGVTVAGVARGGVAPSVGGLDLRGAERLAFRRIRFTGKVQVLAHPANRDVPSAYITFTESELTAPGHCMWIRQGSHHVLLDRLWVHDCSSGVLGPAPATGTEPSAATVAHHITVQDSVFERFAVDAMQFAYWDDVTIQRNVMGGTPPEAEAHNDVIQFTGQNARVRILDNELHGADQVILVQPAVGPIDDVLVAGNVVRDARGYAIQSQGSSNVRFVHNTILRSRYGGLLLRGTHYPAGVPVPTDTVVANNLMSGFGTTDGAQPAVFTGNLTPLPVRGADATNHAGDALLGADLRPSPVSPAVGRAVPEWRTPFDRHGVARPAAATIGALEPAP